MLTFGLSSIATQASSTDISLSIFVDLAENCAPTVNPEILAAIVKTESNFATFAIGVNSRGKSVESYSPQTAAEATKIAQRLISEGKNIDVGLAQINSANFAWLNLDAAKAFDPCNNLKAAEAVLRDGYDRARSTGADPDKSLQMALSAYNTGHFERGVANGYVGKVNSNLRSTSILTHKISVQPQEGVNGKDQKETNVTWDVFGDDTANTTAFVFN